MASLVLNSGVFHGALRGGLVQGRKHVLFARCSLLLLCQRVTGAAVLSFEAQNILAPQIRNRAVDDSSALRPLTEFPRNFRAELGVGRLAHQAQGLLDALFGDEAEEGWLFKLHRQPLPERAVKHRIARRVRKVGEDDGVLVGRRVRLVGVEQPTAHR